MRKKTGFDDFLIALNRYRTLLLWSTTVAVVLPTAAFKVDLTPPWPHGIVLTSALLQVITTAVTFQLLGRASRLVVSRFLIIGACVLLVLNFAYLVGLSQLSFTGGPAKERLVRGLSCTTEALRLPEYAKTCPFLTDEQIAGAEHVDQLWTSTSITEARIMLASLWYLALLMLSACLVAFVVFQGKQRGRIVIPRHRNMARRLGE